MVILPGFVFINVSKIGFPFLELETNRKWAFWDVYTIVLRDFLRRKLRIGLEFIFPGPKFTKTQNTIENSENCARTPKIITLL